MCGELRRVVAVLLLLSSVLVTMPVSAAEIAAPGASLGSVSGVGPVSLRGISIPREGTIFNGDEVQVGSKGYAKVMLVGGHRLELDAATRITIRQTDKNVFVQVQSGNVGFTSSGTSALTLGVGPYEVSPDRNAAGNVALIGKDTLGLRTMKGKVSARQTALNITTVLTQGQERILTFAGQSVAPLTQIASSVPMPIPAAPPVPPSPAPQGGTGTQPSGRSITKAGWIAILATIGGATAAIAVLATRGNNAEDTAAILARQKAIQTTQTAAATGQQASTSSTTVANTATSLNTAIANSTNLSATTRATLTAQANTVISQAQAAKAQLDILNAQIANLQTALANATGDTTAITNQINAVIDAENAQIAVLDQAISNLNAAILAANQAGATNVPTNTVTTIQPEGGISASIPT